MLTQGIKNAFEKGINDLLGITNLKVVKKGPENTHCCGTQSLFMETDYSTFAAHPEIAEEVFGPSSIAVKCNSKDEMLKLAANIKGHLTATLFANKEDLQEYGDLIAILEDKVGRLIINEFPTGVEVCDSIHHGGPFPATTDVRSTSVGSASIKRFARPICYQNFDEFLLPAELKNKNPLKISRLNNGVWNKD
jgi:NADP-dependent aldehyde dehydrogenase